MCVNTHKFMYAQMACECVSAQKVMPELPHAYVNILYMHINECVCDCIFAHKFLCEFKICHFQTITVFSF